MIILEQPYVSDFLQETVVRLQVPVLDTPFVRSLSRSQEMRLMPPGEFFHLLQEQEAALLYSNSENAYEWLHLYGRDLTVTGHVSWFKDKARLREIFSSLNPNIWFRTCSLAELAALDVAELPLPFVVKPRRGFASIGIHAVREVEDWGPALESIRREVVLMKSVFPDAVVSLNDFLLETYIEGPEIAIDAYYNGEGEPVVLNILNHLFVSPSDMSDRLYFTSPEIIHKWHEPIRKYLTAIADLRDLRNFPFHLEMRLSPDGWFVPIEINPMRFMGFCVADVEYWFYGINPYEHYYRQLKPDWERILSSREGKCYGMFGIDIPKHLDKSRISFNYDKFIGHFSHVLHYTKLDYTRFPMAIYLYAEVPSERFGEFAAILNSDLKEFIEFH